MCVNNRQKHFAHRDICNCHLVKWVTCFLKRCQCYPILPYLTLPYLTFFFLYASTAQTAQPIYTHDSSNDALCCKEVPFRGRVDVKLHLGVKTPQKPHILEPGCQISSQINTAE